MKGLKNWPKMLIYALSTPTETVTPKMDTFPNIVNPPANKTAAVMVVVINVINGNMVAMYLLILRDAA